MDQRWLSLLVFVLVPLGFYGASIVRFYRERWARRRRMERWAGGRNLRFNPDQHPGMQDRYPFLSCLRRGRHRYALHVARGRIDSNNGRAWTGGTVTAFDYYYRETIFLGGSRGRSYFLFSVVVIQADFVLPSMLIRPARTGDGIVGRFRASDIRLESDEFNSNFTIRCENRSWAFGFLSPKVIEFLSKHPGYTIEIAGNAVALHTGGEFDPKTFDNAILLGLGLLDRVPADLIKSVSFQRQPRRGNEAARN